MTPDVSIGILSYDGKEKLRECLESILAHTKSVSFEIIVTDNGSVDGTSDMIRSSFGEVRLIRNDVNQKFTRPFNRMLAQAAGRHFLILNNDVTFHDDAISAMVSYLDANPDVAAITPASMEYDGTFERVAKRDPSFRDLVADWTFLGGFARYRDSLPPYDLTQPGAVDVAQDSCLLVRREVWERIGGYDTRFQLYYTEDDLCLRIRRQGGLVHYVPHLRISHAHSYTTKRLPPLSIKWTYSVDMLAYARKHLGWVPSVFFLGPLVFLTFALRLPKWAWQRRARR